MSLLLPYTMVSLALDFSQMVLAVRKHLKMANIIILNNSYYCNFSKKNQSLGMSGLRSYRNLSAPPTLIRAGIPEVFPSGDDPGV